jgi:hypothetical protein
MTEKIDAARKSLSDLTIDKTIKSAKDDFFNRGDEAGQFATKERGAQMQRRVERVSEFNKGAKEREVSFQGEAVDALRRWLTVRDTLGVGDREC